MFSVLMNMVWPVIKMGNFERIFPYVDLDQEHTSRSGYVGFAVLSEKAPIHYRTYDSNEVADLHQPEDAWEGLTGGIIRLPRSRREDRDAQLIGSGPYSVDAYSEVAVDFAMIYGENQNELVENAQRTLQLRNDHWPDVAAISAPKRLSVEEGDSITFEVHLSGAPSGDVTMAVTGYEGTDIKPDQETLTFRADQWSLPQTVTLNTVADEDFVNDEVTLTFTGSGGGYDGVTQEVMITITDNLGVNTEESEQPLSLTLWGNYPNPFSEATKIEFDLPAPARISVIVTDILGRVVKKLDYGQFGVGQGTI